ncbi:MAG: ATP-binding protein, partial [Bacteroidia bacterium]
EAFIANPYLSELDWILNLDSEGKKQGNITAEECRDIIRKLGLKPYEAKYKTVIIWLPEYMRTEGNILLKLLEEPPEQTLIILVAQDADKVIATILSRAQTMRVPRLQEHEITEYLMDKFEATAEVAGAIARIAEGSVVQATGLIKAGHANYFEMFTTWMRLCYNSRKEIEGLSSWVEKAAGEGREFLKSYLTYCQHMLRSCLVYKFGDPKLLRLNEQETAFIQRFSASLTETNISPIVQEINKSTMHLERNADLKITFLNLSLYIGRLLDKQKTA